MVSCGQAVRSGGKPPRTRSGHVRPTLGRAGAPSAHGACSLVAKKFFVTAETYPMSDGWTGANSLRTTIGGSGCRPPGVAVQGEGAAAQVAAAVRGFNALAPDAPGRPDLLIVARGGGSIEDL